MSSQNAEADNKNSKPGIDRKHQGDRRLAEWTWSEQVEHKAPKIMAAATTLYFEWVEREPYILRTLASLGCQLSVELKAPVTVALELQKYPMPSIGIWADSMSDMDPEISTVIEGRIKRRKLENNRVEYVCNSSPWKT